jgi:hypothetical protein
MSDFLQISVKRRQKNGGFLDILKDEYRDYKNDPRNIGNRLKDKVEAWLIEEEILTDPPEANDLVPTLSIGSVIINRICEISGHVWLEFVEGMDEDSIRAAPNTPLDRSKVHLAEFISEIEIDLLLEVFESQSGGGILWEQVTDRHFLDLFASLLEESDDNRKPVPPQARRPAGILNGWVNLFSPDGLQEYSEQWFKDWFEEETGDRMGAYITPVWQVNQPSVVINSLMQKETGLRYSFTPEHYRNADNCVTWASRILDNLVPGDWLDTVRAQCGINQPQCGIDPATLAPKPCEDYHIREQGRMKCVTFYASEADRQRRAGLRRFQ